MSIFDKHQLRIAVQTLKLSDAGAAILGGQTKNEARAVLKKHGWADSKIKQLENEEPIKVINRKEARR